MSSSTQSGEVKELLGYLKNIHSYERQYLKSEGSTITMIWGLFIMVSGLSDLNLALYTGISPHPFPWMGGIAAALIAQQITSSQPLLFEKEDVGASFNRANVSKLESILTVFVFILTFPIGQYNTVLVMPYIGIVFGSANLLVYLRARQNDSDRANDSHLFVVASFYLSSVIILILGFVVQDYTEFAGFIFGILVGGSTFYVGYLSRRKLVEKIENKEESPEL